MTSGSGVCTDLIWMEWIVVPLLAYLMQFESVLKCPENFRKNSGKFPAFCFSGKVIPIVRKDNAVISRPVFYKAPLSV